MGQKVSKEATILAPSMAGNLEDVKRLVGQHIGATKNSDSGALKEFVDRKDAAGNCAMHGAVFAGHLDIVAFLAESCGADLTLKNGMGCSPIWIAAGYNHLKCLEYLVQQLQKKNDVSLEHCMLDANHTGDSPFLAAASKGNIDICKYMLNRLDMKRKLLRTANEAGDTPLKVTVAGGHSTDLLKLLLETDASINRASSNCSEVTMCINRKNNLSLSPLIIACERNSAAAVELLLQHGADAHIQDDKGRHALAVASFCGCDDVVTFLLSQMKQNSSIALLLNKKDNAGCTPLWLAARTGNLKMVELLMDAGADMNQADNEGLTAMDVAAKFKKDKVVEYFQRLPRKSNKHLHSSV